MTLGKYGGDGYPIINGDGSVPYDSQYKVRKDFVYSPTVLLSDQSNWVIDGIEVTNSADDSYNHVGILVFTTGRTGVVSNVTVQNCYVHDVTAEVANSKMTGGILVIGADVWIDGQKPEGEMASEIGFDEVLIENNYVKNVAKEGIRSSGQNTGAEGVGFRNTKTFRNMTFRGNYIEEIFGDGIVLAEVGENGMVENNVVKNIATTIPLTMQAHGCGSVTIPFSAIMKYSAESTAITMVRRLTTISDVRILSTNIITATITRAACF